ncbi:hypothetical protein OAM26_01140 [Porticoccaceae bacterium]|nr:hypothetical protein [Porticoccaceae bacterium]
MTSPHTRVEPIVASRDEIGIAPSQQRRPPPASGNGRGSSGLLWLLLVLVVALGGAAIWQYQTYQQLLSRFEQVENKLSSTDESLSQNGAALQIKIQEQAETLDTHWSEIRKLWGVSNDRNKDNIAANRKDIDFLAAKRADFDKQLSGFSKQIKEQQKNIAQSGVNGLAIAADLERLNADLSKLGSALENLQSKFTAVDEQFNNHAEAIAAFDSYRRQTNQRLLKLESSSAPAAP